MQDVLEATVNGVKLIFKQGDITREKTDAIVNAANSSLMGGGGVDGAIHRAGGPAILEECKKVITRIGRLETGKAVITTGGKLPAKYVIHTVGPVWHGGNSGEPGLLASAYLESLKVAVENALQTVTFPSISTGVYSYPVAKAARVALSTVTHFIKTNPGSLKEITFVLFNNEILRVYQEALTEIKL